LDLASYAFTKADNWLHHVDNCQTRRQQQVWVSGLLVTV